MSFREEDGKMSTAPTIHCYYDRCCQFQPVQYNHRFCTEHKCKRKAENQKKRLLKEDPIWEQVWALQEKKKEHTKVIAQAKNEWLLEKSKIGFFDLETTNLNASIGMILCGSIKVKGGTTITYVAAPGEDGLLTDKQACIDLRDDLESMDYVSTYYGTRFDLPFINTRLLIHGERPINKIRHIDLYFTPRFKLKLHSNRLAVVLETLFGKSGKTQIDFALWNRAHMGNKEALDYVIEHCVADVEELEKVFNKLRGFVNLSATRWRVYGAGY